MCKIVIFSFILKKIFWKYPKCFGENQGKLYRTLAIMYSKFNFIFICYYERRDCFFFWKANQLTLLKTKICNSPFLNLKTQKLQVSDHPFVLQGNTAIKDKYRPSMLIVVLLFFLSIFVQGCIPPPIYTPG